jgi:hypothetical protein
MRWSAAESSRELKKIVLAGSRMIIDMPIRSIGRSSIGWRWSVEHRPTASGQVSAAAGRPGRWRSYAMDYISGSNRRGELLFHLGQIDLFIHNSLHSERNVRFDLDRAWAAMAAKGALLVDDVDGNWGFRSFTLAFPGQQSMIGESEPLRPDLPLFNKKGLFGIVLKQPAAQA